MARTKNGATRLMAEEVGKSSSLASDPAARDDRPDSHNPQAQSGPESRKRIMSRQMAVYYSNCALVAASHREISVMFGRMVANPESELSAGLAELYERHIYMTVEQATDLAIVLLKSVQKFQESKSTRPGVIEHPGS
jgi:hypothetical protein